jgi:glycosyltransferase involved in cell wall biosynthesis
MDAPLSVGAVLPARDEAPAIAGVVAGLARCRDAAGRPLFAAIAVCDNGSSDDTGALAQAAGAIVVREDQAGYGIACQRAVEALGDVDVLVFVDADGSVVESQARALVEAIVAGADLVIGSRTLGRAEAGALTLPQRFGNRLAVALIRALWGARYSDLGPFRAIRMDAYRRLAMRDVAFGWTVEMQVKAAQRRLRVREVPVDSRVRLGRSKISGTVRGVIGAGLGILGMVAKCWWEERRAASAARRADVPRVSTGG